MKRASCLIGIIVFLMSCKAFAQTINVSLPNITLEQVADTILAALPPADTSEGGYQDRFKFFNSFWTPRVTANDSSGGNMFTKYHHYVHDAAVDRLAGGCTTTGFQGNWRTVGPDSLSGQTMGYVSCVWADTGADSGYLLAGSGSMTRLVVE